MSSRGTSHSFLSLITLMVSLIVVLTVSKTTVGQGAVCQNCSGSSQSPTANPAGPYVGLTGQSLLFDGGGSWSVGGPIVSYHWDFGDGTWATGANPNHQYAAEGTYSVSLTVCDETSNCDASESFVTVGAVNVPARIHFDELSNNVSFTDQFQPYLNSYGVRFSSANFFYPPHTYQNCGFCVTTSNPNFLNTKPDDGGQVIVDFTQPVNNLTFYMVGVDAFFNQFAIIDVYRNGTLHQTFPVLGNGTSTVGFTLGSLTNISKIVIRNIADPLGIGFDDFMFNVPSDIRITSSRVPGSLNGTTQTALLDADINLGATPLPAGFAGGNYTWSFTGPVQVLSGLNSSSVTFRSREVGTIVGTVSYTKSGFTATASVTVNSVLPTVTNFAGQQTSDTIAAPNGCGDGFGWWWYRLGCSPQQVSGIQFSASVQVPTLISDPSQSGIKYVQAVSSLRKKVARGFRCRTIRSAENNVASGWQLDTTDPYNETGVQYFSQGNSLTMTTADSPGGSLTGIQNYEFSDSFYVDDQFEMYLVYFTMNPGTPRLQRALAKVPWNWGGLVVFDPNGYQIRFTNVPPTARPSQSTNSMAALQGNVSNNLDVQCPGGPPFTTTNIDSTRVLVRSYYSDILGRNPDPPGWNGWTSYVAQCVFDTNCYVARRSNLALGFFWSPEFTQAIAQADPIMANPPGSPNFNAAAYNPRFVYWCYRMLLLRVPESQAVWDTWTNILNSSGDYAGIVYGFIYSDEYRSRPFS